MPKRAPAQGLPHLREQLASIRANMLRIVRKETPPETETFYSEGAEHRRRFDAIAKRNYARENEVQTQRIKGAKIVISLLDQADAALDRRDYDMAGLILLSIGANRYAVDRMIELKHGYAKLSAPGQGRPRKDKKAQSDFCKRLLAEVEIKSPATTWTQRCAEAAALARKLDMGTVNAAGFKNPPAARTIDRYSRQK